MPRFTLLSTAAILLIGATAPGCAVPIPVALEQKPAAQVTVTGEGKRRVAPDVALANLGIEVTAPSVGEAYRSSEAATRALNDALRQHGVAEKDIRTVHFSILPDYRMEKGGSAALSGYKVFTSVNVRIQPIDRIPAALAAVTGVAGNAVRVHNIQLAVDDPSLLRQELEAQAMDDATAQAGRLAAQAGARLGRVVALDAGARPPITIRAQPGGAGTGEKGGWDGSLAEGELELRLQVQVTYRLD